jgi:tRNA (guanine-N7-)-methyltransferase
MRVPPSECVPPLQPAEQGGWDLEIPLGNLERPLHFPGIFGRTGPVEIEIGSGSGLFLAEEAKRRPEVDFFAIELDTGEVHRAKDKWRRRDLLNTRIVRCDAHYFLEEFLAPASVDAFIILYSDPWPKKRHHKRRLFQPRLLEPLRRALKPGGLITIKTDVTAYYEVIRELFDGAQDWAEWLFDKRLDFEPEPDDIVTNFQRKAIEAGHPLHYLRLRRRAAL